MDTFFLRIRPDRISFLRFLLEGYDGLAVLSTLDAEQGLIRLMVPHSRTSELWGMLTATCKDLSPAVPSWTAHQAAPLPAVTA